MHISICENNLFRQFEQKRKDLGYTTTTSAVLEALRLFINHDFSSSIDITDMNIVKDVKNDHDNIKSNM